MRRLITLLLIALVTGCGGGDAPTTTLTPVDTPTTTTMVTTTTSATTTTTGERFDAGQPALAPPDPMPGSDGAAGSGCTPFSVELPDGIWFGYITVRAADGFVFDLACFYFGDVAYDEGAKDGEEVANDYYIRNENPVLRTVGVDPIAATVHEIGWDQAFITVPYPDWPVDPTGYTPCPGEFCGVWLYVNDGAVTEIVEQYVP